MEEIGRRISSIYCPSVQQKGNLPQIVLISQVLRTFCSEIRNHFSVFFKNRCLIFKKLLTWCLIPKKLQLFNPQQIYRHRRPMDVAETCRQKGNELLQRGDFADAAQQYDEGLVALLSSQESRSMCVFTRLVGQADVM